VVADAPTAGVRAPTRLPERTVENVAAEIATGATAIAVLVREEDREETEAEARIRMRAHTAWLLDPRGPESPCWTSVEEATHYERRWNRAPWACHDDWDGGAESGVMYGQPGAEADAYVAP
jgi:hypothetical protein